MTIYLVRHARAGRRSAWDGPDEARPLSRAGQHQSIDVADLLDDNGVERVLSSPYVRCVETVEPLAERIGVEVEAVECLAEGSGPDRVAALLAELDGDDVVLCTHGDVALVLLTLVRRDGVKLRAPRSEKGSVWTIGTKKGRFTSASYRPPKGR